MAEDNDVLQDLEKWIGDHDYDMGGYGGLYDVIDTLTSAKYKIEELQKVVQECKNAGSYDARQHQLDLKDRDHWKKAYQTALEHERKNDGMYNKLRDKYFKMCCAYTGLSLDDPIDLNNPNHLSVFCASDNGYESIIEAAETRAGIK